MNCPMLRAIGVGGQTSHLWTFIFHCQTVRRHMAKDTAASSVPMVKGMMHLAQGTSSPEMPWTANWSHCVVFQVGSMVSRVSPSLLMSTWYSAHCPGLPLEDSGLPSAGLPGLSSSHRTMWQTGVCGVWKSSSNASSSSREARAVPLLE